MYSHKLYRNSGFISNLILKPKVFKKTILQIFSAPPEAIKMWSIE